MKDRRSKERIVIVPENGGNYGIQEKKAFQ